MANHPSALKRQRQNEKKRIRNKSYSSTINTYVKRTLEALENKDADGAKKYYREAIIRLDSAVNKGILHKKTASRKISRLTRRINAFSA